MTLRAALAIVAVLGITACGGGDRERDAPVAPSARMVQTRALPREQLRRGGVLVWPINSMPANFNANRVDGTENTGGFIVSALMPSMFRSDGSGTPRWNPDYLASAPVLSTAGAQAVTYMLNPKAHWSDDTPITWWDFYWQWRALNGSDKAYQASSTTGYADIENVSRGRDDREIVVTFRRRFADWPKLFAPLYPASTNRSADQFNAGWRMQPAISGGPFALERLDAGAHTVTLVRSETWWGQPALLDRIVFRAIEPDVQVDALANGEVDVMDIGPDTNKYTRIRALPGVDVRQAGGPNFRHLLLNTTSPKLRDVMVRRAVAPAIDRAAIARAMLGPLGAEPEPLGNHLFMRNHVGYRDNSGDVAYDPLEAARLLDAAGWTLANGSRTQAGAPLTITCVIPGANATSKQEAELIQNMLAQVGVNMTISVVPGNVFFPKYVLPGGFDVTLFSWFADAFPLSSSRPVYAKPTVEADGRLSIQLNVARVGSDEIDRLFDAATQELDATKALEIGNRIDTLVWQEVHSLPLYQRPELWAVKRQLANFGAVGLSNLVYQDIGWMK